MHLLQCWFSHARVAFTFNIKVMLRMCSNMHGIKGERPLFTHVMSKYIESKIEDGGKSPSEMFANS